MAFVEARALNPSAARAPDADAGAQLSSLRSQLGYGRRFRPGRNHLVLLIVIVIGAWVVVGFGRTITSMNAAMDRQQVLTTETQALAAQLEVGNASSSLVQTDGFQALQARAFGIGAPGEIAFCARGRCAGGAADRSAWLSGNRGGSEVAHSRPG